MLKLNKLTIVGFKSKTRQVIVNFSYEIASVIYGDNGSGKTSILKIINAILIQDEITLRQEKVEAISIDYTYYNNDIKSDTKSETITIQRNDNISDENCYNWDEFKSSKLFNSKSLSLGVQRGVTTQQTYIEPEYIYNFFFIHSKYRALFDQFSLKSLSEELAMFINDERREIYRKKLTRMRKRNYDTFDKNHVFLQSINIENIEDLLIERYRLAREITTRKIQNALFDTLASAINPNRFTDNEITIDENFTEILFKNKERIIEALESLDSNNFKEEIINFLKGVNKNNFNQKNLEISESKLLNKLLFKMIKELELEQQILRSINLIVDKFNEFLITGKKLILEPNRVYIKIGENHHSLNELSSGERHILTFLTLVLIEGENRDFLIIDEPEISLNIKWQRELLPLFIQLIPNTQIIVASHSPSIVQRKQNYLVKLEVKEN